MSVKEGLDLILGYSEKNKLVHDMTSTLIMVYLADVQRTYIDDWVGELLEGDITKKDFYGHYIALFPDKKRLSEDELIEQAQNRHEENLKLWKERESSLQSGFTIKLKPSIRSLETTSISISKQIPVDLLVDWLYLQPTLDLSEIDLPAWYVKQHLDMVVGWFNGQQPNKELYCNYVSIYAYCEQHSLLVQLCNNNEYQYRIISKSAEAISANNYNNVFHCQNFLFVFGNSTNLFDWDKGAEYGYDDAVYWKSDSSVFDASMYSIRRIFEADFYDEDLLQSLLYIYDDLEFDLISDLLISSGLKVDAKLLETTLDSMKGE